MEKLKNILTTSSKNNFLDKITKFISNNYQKDFSKLKVLLPNGLICNKLQHLLIKQHGTIILPNIMPISDLIAEEEEIFKIPSKQIGVISRLEEKIILAEIINSNNKINYNLSQSLRLSTSLAQLFFEIEINKIEFKDIQLLPKLDESKHWNIIYDSLKSAHTKWQDTIQNLKKITRAKNQEQTLQAEINRLKNHPDEYLIIAGIIGDNRTINNFIKQATKLTNVKLILPPFDQDTIQQKLTFEKPLYKIQKFLSELNYKQIDLNILGQNDNSLLDKLVYNNSSDKYNNNIEYIELENNLHESEYIALKCQQYIKAYPDCNIAIIAHSQEDKELYSTFLRKNYLHSDDLFGTDILSHPIISLILLISELQYCKFSLHSFFALLSHPEIIDDTTIRIKNIIKRNNRFASNIESMTEIIAEHGSDRIIAKLSKFTDYIKLVDNIGNNFHSLLEHTLKTSEQILPTIWKYDQDINNLLAEIIQINWDVTIDNIDSFPELLKQILIGGRIVTKNSNNNIIICKSSDIALINYDLVIISSINENIYPKLIRSNPWLNLKMQKELGLENTLTEIGYSLYEYYLNLNNKYVVITRAKRVNGTQTIPSQFILHLKSIIGNKLVSKNALLKTKDITGVEKETTATSTFFPTKVSATDIETLIRAPYNFYIKKILKLYQDNKISDTANLADFGNFFHYIAHQIAITYPVPEIQLLEHIDQYFNKFNIPDHSRKIWHAKITAIVPELIEFEHQRRKQIKSLHCEIKGTICLKIQGLNITLSAIADRIEVGNNGEVCIIDYKTGTIPPKKDILSGLSPQLIIESIILSENGFNIDFNSIKKITYIKINSHSPYLKIINLEISEHEIKQHKQGLVKMLEHYITTNQYPIEPCITNYDEYKYFARRQ